MAKSKQIAVAQRVLAGQGPGASPVCSKTVTRYVSARTSANVRTGPGLGYCTVSTEAVLPRGSVKSSSSTKSSRPSNSRARKLAIEGIRGLNTHRAIESCVGTSRNGTLDHTTIEVLQNVLEISRTARRTRTRAPCGHCSRTSTPEASANNG